jgi:UDP-galactopyranose mutase
LEPKELSPSVCGRIPVRFNDDDRYFTDKYQFMPKYGFTKMFEKMLEHKNIEIQLKTDYRDVLKEGEFAFTIYTGPIDYFFNYMHGKLPYRSIHFVWKNYDVEKYQNAAVVNHVSPIELFTRVSEYKYFNGQQASTTTLSYEYTQVNGEPFYPILTQESSLHYKLYSEEARKINNVLFCGRLAAFQYYNMDQVVANSLSLFKRLFLS